MRGKFRQIYEGKINPSSFIKTKGFDGRFFQTCESRWLVTCSEMEMWGLSFTSFVAIGYILSWNDSLSITNVKYQQWNIQQMQREVNGDGFFERKNLKWCINIILLSTHPFTT